MDGGIFQLLFLYTVLVRLFWSQADFVEPSKSGLVKKYTSNFSSLVNLTKGVDLTFNNKPINMEKFEIHKADMAKLDNILRGDDLKDRLYVASKLAEFTKMIATAHNISMTSFALEDLPVAEDDIVLSPEDVDEIELMIKNQPDILDINTPSHVTDEEGLEKLGLLEINPQELNFKSRVKRKVSADSSKWWSTTIPYEITSDFLRYPKEVRVIRAGIKNWEDETCLKFVKKITTAGPHIKFRRRRGCFSKLGKRPNGQIISIGSGCTDYKGITSHVIAHALGFIHEHTRPDRSQYVTVETGFLPGLVQLNRYLQMSWKEVKTLEIPYDYSSVMHYDVYEDSVQVMSTKDTDMESTPGQRLALSFYDVKIANYHYCADRCQGGLTWSKCRHDGYRDPKNCTKCRCPDGWTGAYCTEIQDPVNIMCGPKELTATLEWKNLSSPNYDTFGLSANSQCTWRLKAEGQFKRVVVRFIDQFSIQSPCRLNRCDRNYIEVRYKDLARVGPRYCCKKPSRYIKSYGNETMLLMRINFDSGLKGFKIQYKSEPCGGCSSPTSMSGPACMNTESYRCYGIYSEPCGTGRCTRYRLNTCYKESRYCCPGFQLVNDQCNRLTNMSEGILALLKNALPDEYVGKMPPSINQIAVQKDEFIHVGDYPIGNDDEEEEEEVKEEEVEEDGYDEYEEEEGEVKEEEVEEDGYDEYEEEEEEVKEEEVEEDGYDEYEEEEEEVKEEEVEEDGYDEYEEEEGEVKEEEVEEDGYDEYEEEEGEVKEEEVEEDGYDEYEEEEEEVKEEEVEEDGYDEYEEEEEEVKEEEVEEDGYDEYEEEEEEVKEEEVEEDGYDEYEEEEGEVKEEEVEEDGYDEYEEEEGEDYDEEEEENDKSDYYHGDDDDVDEQEDMEEGEVYDDDEVEDDDEFDDDDYYYGDNDEVDEVVGEEGEETDKSGLGEYNNSEDNRNKSVDVNI